jgi:hypothetical protein
MKYTTLDANGLPTAFYSDDINKTIPQVAIEITDDQWLECINNSGQRCFKGGVLVPYVAAVTLTAAQQTQLAIIDSAYDTAIPQPVTYMTTTFQADKDSQDSMLKSINWLKSIVDIGETIPADFGWWDTTNVKVPMTLEQLQGLYVASGNIANSAFTHKQDLKAAIRAATKVTAVTKIVW